VSESLGKLEAWQIREFPRDLRLAIVAAAKERQQSPGEFATAIFLRAREAGWWTDDGAHQLTVSNGSPAPPSPPSLAEIAQATATISTIDTPSARGTTQLGIRVLRGRLSSMLPPSQRIAQPARQPGREPGIIAGEQVGGERRQIAVEQGQERTQPVSNGADVPD
jgi:hypothetical protein